MEYQSTSSTLVELLSRGELLTPSAGESLCLCMEDSLLSTGEAWGRGMKARPDEDFLLFLPTFSIQRAKSQFQAKYGILPTGAAAQPHPGWAASYPPPAPSHELARGLTSKDENFFTCPHMPTLSRPNLLYNKCEEQQRKGLL